MHEGVGREIYEVTQSDLEVPDVSGVRRFHGSLGFICSNLFIPSLILIDYYNLPTYRGIDHYITSIITVIYSIPIFRI